MFLPPFLGKQVAILLDGQSQGRYSLGRNSKHNNVKNDKNDNQISRGGGDSLGRAKTYPKKKNQRWGYPRLDLERRSPTRVGEKGGSGGDTQSTKGNRKRIISPP